MRSPFYFIVKPLDNKRYTNTKDIDGMDFITSTSEENHMASNRQGVVVATPLGYDGDIEVGDLLIVHHNVFKFYYDMQGREKSGKSFFMEDMFLVDEDQFFLYYQNKKWIAHSKYCFIKPIPAKNSALYKGCKEEPLFGVVKYINKEFKDVSLVGYGRSIEIFKQVGNPKDVVKKFNLESFSGTHGIGHTRMATESAITTDGSHPYSTGEDECLVHNGSLSNHNNLRRELKKKGNTFNSENDTEVAAGYVSNSLSNNNSLKDTLMSGLKDLDGFYTFITGTRNGFAVVRDEIACKPAVIAETNNYVAIASEFQAMAHLPDVNNAKIFEPEPGVVYSWGN